MKCRFCKAEIVNKDGYWIDKSRYNAGFCEDRDGRRHQPEDMPGTLKVWTCTGFTGIWPVGVAAIVSAESKERAAEILNTTLKKVGLPGDAAPEYMNEFDIYSENVEILNNGEY